MKKEKTKKTKKKRNRSDSNRPYLVTKIIALANLSRGKKTDAYLTKLQMTELVVYLAMIMEEKFLSCHKS